MAYLIVSQARHLPVNREVGSDDEVKVVKFFSHHEGIGLHHLQLVLVEPRVHLLYHLQALLHLWAQNITPTCQRTQQQIAIILRPLFSSRKKSY